jgi:hypothetical protein
MRWAISDPISFTHCEIIYDISYRKGKEKEGRLVVQVHGVCYAWL